MRLLCYLLRCSTCSRSSQQGQHKPLSVSYVPSEASQLQLSEHMLLQLYCSAACALLWCLSHLLVMRAAVWHVQLAWFGVAFWGVVFYAAFGGKKKEAAPAAAEEAKPAAAH